VEAQKTDKQLTYKESLFVDEYIACAGNATVAYCRAYQKENNVTSRKEASKKVNDPFIKAEIQRRTKPHLLTLKQEEEVIRKRLMSMIDGSDPNASNSDAVRAADVLNRMSARYLNRTTDETQKQDAVSSLDDSQLIALISEKP
jgi:phage terminase small subunit